MHGTISDFQRWVGIWDSYLFPSLLLFLCGFLIWFHNVASAALLRNVFLGLLNPSESINKNVNEILGEQVRFSQPLMWLKSEGTLDKEQYIEYLIFWYIHIVWIPCSKRKVVKVKSLLGLSCDVPCEVLYSSGTAIVLCTQVSWAGDGEWLWSLVVVQTYHR